jgi:hypothetical protein
MDARADTGFDFDDALLALLDRIGQPVRISVCAARGPRPASQVVDVEGTFAAGWDPEAVRSNGVEDGAVFGLEETDAVSLYLLREDFNAGELHGDKLVLFTGGVAVVVQPALQAGS